MTFDSSLVIFKLISKETNACMLNDHTAPHRRISLNSFLLHSNKNNNTNNSNERTNKQTNKQTNERNNNNKEQTNNNMSVDDNDNDDDKRRQKKSLLMNDVNQDIPIFLRSKYYLKKILSRGVSTAFV